MAVIFYLLTTLAIAEMPAEPSDNTFQQAVEQVVEQFIHAHPEVIEQTLQALQVKREAEERERISNLIATKQAELLNDPSSPVSVNLEADVTVVEFFDYRNTLTRSRSRRIGPLQSARGNWV